jgi:hypothetical protein
MVLKVVTGKILETLELRSCADATVPFWNSGVGTKLPSAGQFVKDRGLSCRYYLRTYIIGCEGVRVKQKVGGLLMRFQIGNLAPTLSAKNAEKDGAPTSLAEETGPAPSSVGARRVRHENCEGFCPAPKYPQRCARRNLILSWPRSNQRVGGRDSSRALLDS